MKIAICAEPARSGSDLTGRICKGLMAEDMERFEEALQHALAEQGPYLTDTERSLYSGGKKLRPLLLLLCARMTAGPTGQLPGKAIQGAAALEMLHVATLIHDDIIDCAPTRRGGPSVNAARGNDKAIILGDMQFLQSIRTFTGSIEVQNDMALVQMVLDTALDICRGEMDELQTGPAQDVETLKKGYWQTIERKTAVLFGLSCEAGAILGGAHTSDARRAGFFGRRFGRAFQIMDDVFDVLLDAQAAGKDAGMDLANRRMSLPIIYALEARQGESRLKQFLFGPSAPEAGTLAEGVREIILSGAIARAYADAREQALEALEYLRLPPRNRYTEALEELTHYVVNRSR